jgi:hypothetical protein
VESVSAAFSLTGKDCMIKRTLEKQFNIKVERTREIISGKYLLLLSSNTINVDNDFIDIYKQNLDIQGQLYYEKTFRVWKSLPYPYKDTSMPIIFSILFDSHFSK